MYYVYILLCSDKSLYTGITNDPDKRFRTHVEGKGGAYTRSHKPVKIIHLEQVDSKSIALKRELEIKHWTRQQKVTNLKLMV